VIVVAVAAVVAVEEGIRDLVSMYLEKERLEIDSAPDGQAALLKIEKNDYDLFIVDVDGEERVLTPKEFELLYYLAKSPGRVYTREQILENVWGYDYFGDLRTVDTHVEKLREKLGRSNGPDYISTVWGLGYKFGTFFVTGVPFKNIGLVKK